MWLTVNAKYLLHGRDVWLDIKYFEVWMFLCRGNISHHLHWWVQSMDISPNPYIESKLSHPRLFRNCSLLKRYGTVGAIYLRWSMNVRQALTPEKRFLSPRRGSNLQPSDDRWDALTIGLPRLRWRAQEQFRHMCRLVGSHEILIMISMRHMW